MMRARKPRQQRERLRIVIESMLEHFRQQLKTELRMRTGVAEQPSDLDVSGELPASFVAVDACFGVGAGRSQCESGAVIQQLADECWPDMARPV